MLGIIYFTWIKWFKTNCKRSKFNCIYLKLLNKLHIWGLKLSSVFYFVTSTQYFGTICFPNYSDATVRIGIRECKHTLAHLCKKARTGLCRCMQHVSPGLLPLGTAPAVTNISSPFGDHASRWERLNPGVETVVLHCPRGYVPRPPVDAWNYW